MTSLSYKDLVNYLMEVSSGITNESGYTMEYVDFGFDYEMGLDDNTVGYNWKYPACFIIPSDSTHDKNSDLYFNFTIAIINKIKKDKSNRLEIYDKLMTWSVAFVQYLDQYLTIEYDLSLVPIDVNYDSESIGWTFSISIYSHFDCVLDDTGGPTETGPLGGYIGSGTSGTSGLDGQDGVIGGDGTSGTSGVDGNFYGSSGTSGVGGTSGT